MTTAALEINDAGILVAEASRPNRPRGTASPGYALLDGTTLLTGAAAVSRARLKPRHVHNRFWSGLDMTPLGRPFSHDLTTADLAHAHLSQVWELCGGGVDEALLVVPGSFSDAQLGLLLGVARACGVPAVGMVDSATAAGMHGWSGARLLHVDLQLHQVVVTELTQATEVARGRVETGEGAGWVAIQDALARSIATIFLRDTRFDPTDSARTEQQLYDGLPHWLAGLRREESVALRFESGGKDYGIELTRQRLVESLEAEYRRIAQLVSSLKPAGETTCLLLSHRVALLPGLEERLAAIHNTRVELLPSTAPVAGALASLARIRVEGDELPYVTRLPARPVVAPPLSAPRGQTVAAPAPESNAPTHVLLAGTAHEIRVEPLVLGLAIPDGARGVRLESSSEGISRSHCSLFRRGEEVLVEDHSSHGTFLNGERVEGRAALDVGDRLRIGSPGVELDLIKVAKDDGTAQG